MGERARGGDGGKPGDTLADMTLLCVPIMVQDADQALADAQAARDAGADLVEFRVDGYFHGTGDAGEMRAVAGIVEDSPLPSIVTCRSADEGGQYDGPDDARVALYEYLGTAKRPPRYFDLELAAYERSANLRQKVHLAVDHPARRRADAPSLILSMHDFKTRPADLARRVARLAETDAASVVKIAFRARSLRDNLELFDLLTHATKPTIALGMGEFGLMSRVLTPKFGGFLTFASLRPTTGTAPGQPTVRELEELYRFRAIGRATRVYGVIGWPIEHSRSPHVHNAAFAALGIDAVYVPLPIAVSEDAEATYANFKGTLLDLLHDARVDFSGASVTHPHKQHLVRLAREQGWRLDKASAANGAANTIAIERRRGAEPTVHVLNTDAAALRAVAESVVGSLAGRSAVILGAGGVARAGAWALLGAGARVTIRARREDQAHALVDGLGAPASLRCEAWDTPVWHNSDLVINATPMGMFGGPAPDESPLSEAALVALPPGAAVFDTVYNPAETPLLRAARAAGRRAFGGMEMFVHQAAAQLRAWTGMEPPLEAMRRAAAEANP